MGDDFIKREKFKNILESKAEMAIGTPKEVFYNVIKMLELIPAEDVVRKRKARWKGAGMGDYYCSLCNTTFSDGDEFKFCPECGADMRQRSD